ncbi:MAG: hypothetical protein JJE45_08445 [Prolixibacteraceae bacterium]|nr:hypothetical protein [Prolixibacteraceae bacterium]
MTNEENNLKKIQGTIESIPDNFSILEERIDITLQKKYFSYTKKRKDGEKIANLSELEDQLNNSDEKLDQKRKILVRLAGQNQIESFRIIERFQKKAKGVIKKWAILALQESRMVMQSSLLGEQQVFISTGLGGKGKKIRYFFAFNKKDIDTPFTPGQDKIIRIELEEFLAKNEGELEKVRLSDGIVYGLFLFPLKKDLQNNFNIVIEKSNQYGNFLNNGVLITNVQALSLNEIKNLINLKEKKDKNTFIE